MDGVINCIQGSNLLQHSRNPQHLRGFLELRADRLGHKAELQKSIIVLRGKIGSGLQMTARPTGLKWPMLRRTGQYPPSMLIPELDNIISVDPDEQRIGCDFIDHLRAAHFFARAYLNILVLYSKLPKNISCGDHLHELFGTDDQSLFTNVQPSLADDQPLFKDQDLHRAAEILTTLYISGRYNDRPKHGDFCSKLETALNEPGLLKNIRKSLLKDSMQEEGDEEAAMKARQSFDRAATLLHYDLKSSTHSMAAIRNIGNSPVGTFFEHIVLQGCGDVSMNDWNLCFLTEESEDERKYSLIHVPGEPVDDREYSCLISWDAQKATHYASELKQISESDKVFSAGAETPTLSIGRVRVNQYGKTSRLRLITGQKPFEIDKFVQYAVYGQKLAWDGKVVEPRSVAPEFSDVRHLLNLANQNPDSMQLAADKADEAWSTARRAAISTGFGDLFKSEKCPDAFRQQPRYMFGVPAEHDVWLGEKVLLPTDHLLQAACEHPVEIELSQLGTTWDWITVCMIHWGYKLMRGRDAVVDRGDFTWDKIDPAKPKLIVFFQKALYPCTLVGIGKLIDKEKPRIGQELCGDLFLLAWGHGFNKDQGYTIFDCAKLLVDLGAQAVLLIDEGNDVFQHYFADLHKLQMHESLSGQDAQNVPDGVRCFPVNAKREQMRATLSFWVEE